MTPPEPCPAVEEVRDELERATEVALAAVRLAESVVGRAIWHRDAPWLEDADARLADLRADLEASLDRDRLHEEAEDQVRERGPDRYEEGDDV